MAEFDPIARVLIELRRAGQLDAILRVILDAHRQYRAELENFLHADLLVTELQRASIFALQGQMKTCQELLATFETLATEPAPAVRDDSAIH